MQRSSELEFVSPRLVFQVYAVWMALVGVFLYAWGPVWINGELNGQPYGLNALVRIAGAFALLLACASAGLARLRDTLDARRALLWFVGGHYLLTLLIMMQGRVIWGNQLPLWYAALLNSLLLISSLLLGGMAVVEDRGRRAGHLIVQLLPHVGVDHRLRSQYEDEIRKAAAQEERNRLARDLHDSIKQQVFAIQTSAATAETRLATDSEGAAHALAQVRENARSAMAELEAVSEGLRAAPLELSGLSAALRRECEALELRTGARVVLSVDPLPPGALLPPGSAEALFRITQEALSNVARHARARNVEITVRRTAYHVELAIQDDGVGFNQTETGAGDGLANMRARAKERGGTLDVTTRPGAGTAITASIPVDAVDPKYFRSRAMWYTLATVAVGLVFLAHWVPVTFEASFLPLAIFGFNGVRYTVAWLRARRLAAVAA